MEQKDIEKVKKTIDEFVNKNLFRVVVSKPLVDKTITKVVVRTVQIQGILKYQETKYVGTQVFHENLSEVEVSKHLADYIVEGTFGQLESECTDKRVMILANKKGTVTIKVKHLDNSQKNNAVRNNTNSNTNNENNCNQIMNHNRTKNYILQDGEPVDFLIELGVMTPEGKVVKARYDKFKQINRYLEFVQDVLPSLPSDRTIRIVDFGCGKSYLTFALYYYLKVKKNYDIQIIGLDLKKDVIANCNALKDKLGYNKLVFLHGDIKDFTGNVDSLQDGELQQVDEATQVDMVVTLHACDTATDYAMEKAVKWNASVIMTVPCCQHELNKQMKANEIPEMKSLLKYGLIKERMAALITDAYRANCLEQAGYDVQIMEFIDMEHTPKNILIRAVKNNRRMRMTTKASQELNSLKQMDEFFKIEPTLEKLLFSEENS